MLRMDVKYGEREKTGVELVANRRRAYTVGKKANAGRSERERMQQLVRRVAKSACPHDCPSACALEVPVLADGRVGRITGARDNSYTLGVVCAKVARYAERIEHPGPAADAAAAQGSQGRR